MSIRGQGTGLPEGLQFTTIVFAAHALQTQRGHVRWVFVAHRGPCCSSYRARPSALQKQKSPPLISLQKPHPSHPTCGVGMVAMPKTFRPMMMAVMCH